MTKLNPGMIFEDHEGYLFWVLYVDSNKGLVYVQDDPLHVLSPCTRVIRVYRVGAELERDFTIREAFPEEISKFTGVNPLDTIPSPPHFDSFSPASAQLTLTDGRTV